MSEDIFRHADRSLMVIFNQLAREFQGMGTTLGFDELNVQTTMQMVEVAYRRIDEVVQREYRDIAIKAYRDACREAGYSGGQFETDRFVSDMLRAYDPLTEYVFVHEWERKRDRLIESIVAVERGNQDMRKALKRAMDLLARQIRQYADNITAQARIRAFKDAGEDVLVWITKKDEKVCPVCNARDEQFYPIEYLLGNYPAHYHCRCIVLPVDMEESPRHKSRS